MNCSAVQRQLSAERDGASASSGRAALVSHLAECADCRRFQVVIAEAADAWRSATARVTVPDSELAWQAVRREIRSNGAGDRTTATPWFSRWALPVGAAATLAIATGLMAPHWRSEPAGVRDVARADFVEVGGASSPMVYVDDKSGWLVVWAADEANPKNG